MSRVITQGWIHLFVLVTWPLLASGQEAERRFQKRTFFDFDDDVVLGELVKPDGAFVKVGLGTRRMARANRMAARILEHRMRRRRPNDLKLIRQAAAADVIVVRGHYDKVQAVLRAVKVEKGLGL